MDVMDEVGGGKKRNLTLRQNVEPKNNNLAFIDVVETLMLEALAPAPAPAPVLTGQIPVKVVLDTGFGFGRTR